MEPHHLVPVRNAPRVLLPRSANGRAARTGPGLHRLAIFFEPGHGSRTVLDLENHLDPTRKGFGAPTRVEDNLDDITGRMALMQLHQCRKVRVRSTDRPSSRVTEPRMVGRGRNRLGLIFGTGLPLRRRGFRLLLGLVLGGINNVLNALNALSATGAQHELLRVGVVNVLESSGLAVQRLDPPARHAKTRVRILLPHSIRVTVVLLPLSSSSVMNVLSCVVGCQVRMGWIAMARY